ncbi:NHL repeat-containing protein [Actinoplanes awajinensis]|uniref:Gluconolaconase n=1 Tax=Actinoplanes awajinensis subsp. mycoplanecinus TaxID=135947 RepID=A0A101J8V3_9ACTN|nr:hypothetical protein [Actinoplanes awajinensis]KUL22339.1 hypothetical protein ADL15_48250 [Actinoplanes awajinensis subsp. mycoplanecinus]
MPGLTPLRGTNGVTLGPDGRLWVAQFLAGRIAAVDPATGDVEVIVAPDGPIQAPDDLAFGADGSLYVADLVPGRVWRRSPGGEFQLVTDEVRLPNGITCVGDRLFVNEMIPGGRLLELFTDGRAPVVLTGSLAMGNAMQAGPDGRLYYPHMITGEVWRIPVDGGDPELVAEGLPEPVAVRFDRAGALLVLSRDAAGTVTRLDGARRSLVTTGIVGMDNATFDDENRMFVSSYAGGGITEVRPDGRTREVVPGGLNGPHGVTVDLAGAVHAADHYGIAGPDAFALHTFAHGIAASAGLFHLTSQYGQVKTFDPGSGSARLRAAGLDRPTGLSVRPDGALVVAEAGAGRVLVIDADDAVSVLAEGLGRPVDVALDSDGRCYVSDEERGSVYRIDAGVPVEVASGLSAPQGLAISGDELFVVETGNGRVLAIALDGSSTRIVAEGLAVGASGRTEEPLLTAHGLPGVPRPFAGLAAGPGGTLHLAADGLVLQLPVGIS